MKKILITIGSMLILSLVVVLFVNAGTTPKDPVKPKTEVKKDACAAECQKAAGQTTCDPAECKDKDNCDPATCKVHQAEKKEAPCVQAAPCAATCQGMKTATK
jgi:hypothetical protein